MSQFEIPNEGALTGSIGLCTDGPSDLPWTGLCSETYGVAKLSISVPSSMPTETSTILGDKEYEQAPSIYREIPSKADTMCRYCSMKLKSY